MEIFTIVTGLASLCGLAIQVFDFFPKLGRARETIFVLFGGIFVGSLLRALDPSGIKFNFQVTGFTIIIGLFAAVIVGLLTAAVLSADETKRFELYAVSGVGLTVLVPLLFFGALSDASTETKRLTITELNALSESAVQNRDFNRALMHLRTIESIVRADNTRLKLIRDKIRQIELEELK